MIERFRVAKAVIIIMIILLGVASCNADTSNYSNMDFGSKVRSGDPDIGHPLEDFVYPQIPATIGYWDIGIVPMIPDDADVFYLHFGLGPIRSNDIRLTPFGELIAGSKVTSNDNDIGKEIVEPNPKWQFKFVDRSGIKGGYDLDDMVYIGAGPIVALPTSFNEIRLTSLGSNLLSGTRVIPTDTDSNLPTITLNTAPYISPPGIGSLAVIRFYNANGNVISMYNTPIYDDPDPIYLDMPLTDPLSFGGKGVVSVGDIRLTEM